MLTKLIIHNLKRFNDVEIELGNPVVFIGPNDSGKTTALQALALWDIGLRRWNEKRKDKTTPEKRPGVTINRRDLIAIPVPGAKLLWHNLEVGGKYIDILIEGVTSDKEWKCGFEFYYANEESFYCRPLRISEEKEPQRLSVPDDASDTHIAFLPAMSGLAARETKQEQGAINVLIGEGRTAEVLRNLCYRIVSTEKKADRWEKLCERMNRLFGVSLDIPKYVAERGEIYMSYKTQNNVTLDISSSGRGLQQTLLLLAHLEVNPNSVLLLDEPDAHLEILRQRQIYNLLTEAAQEQFSQVIIASHSEIILNEAADRDMVVAFVGKPHRIDDRGSQAMKSLKEIGFDQYYQAEQTGWVLYVEGATDLAILLSFAETLGHAAKDVLERPFAHYICNQPSKGRDHFRGLRDAKKDLVGFVLCDRLESALQSTPELREMMWNRREIENYLCQRETLLAFAEAHGRDSHGPLFAGVESARRRQIMEESITRYISPAALHDPNDQWWFNTKASDEFLDRVFAEYLSKLNLPLSLMKKSDYHILARFVSPALVSPDIVEVLDAILDTSRQAKPAIAN